MSIKTTFYKVVCLVSGRTYIGSTTTNLKLRMLRHLCNYRAFLKGNANYCSCFKILRLNDYIVKKLLERDNITIQEKILLEKKFIDEEKIKTRCVNIQVPGRTMKEWIKDNRDYVNGYYRDYYNEKIKDKKIYCSTCKKKLLKKYFKNHLLKNRHIKKSQKKKFGGSIL